MVQLSKPAYSHFRLEISLEQAHVTCFTIAFLAAAERNTLYGCRISLAPVAFSAEFAVAQANFARFRRRTLQWERGNGPRVTAAKVG